MSPLYVFPHVPKCAGSSVSQFFRANLPGEAVLRIDEAEREAFIAGGPEAREAVARARFAIGHHLPRSLVSLAEPGREVREMVMLRDPVSYYRSLYVFYRRHSRRQARAHALSFEQWYRCQTPDPIVHHLLARYLMVPGWREALMREDDCLRLVSTALSRFWFVGSFRHCQALIDRIAQDQGFPVERYHRNVARGSFELPDGFAERILAENRADAALFEAWKDRMWDGSHDSGRVAKPPGRRRRLVQIAGTVPPRLRRALAR